MPIHGYPGNVITANPTAPTSSVATGVWTTEQQLLAVSQGNWPGYEYPISNSLRFNSADSAYLNRTPASASNRRTWSWSGWVKRGALGSAIYPYLITAYDSSGARETYFNIEGDCLRFSVDNTSSGNIYLIQTTQVFRDPSAWYHIMVVLDTTQATTSDRLKMYVNGTQITAFSTANYPAQNYDATINLNVIHTIGRSARVAAYYYDGYLTEVNFVDGQALTPSSFGLNDPETGVWSPKRYTGTYGTNGFYLNFSDNSNTTAATLGKDYSGNGNNWTPNNFSVTAGVNNDSMVDTPTNYGTDTGVGGEVRGNYATLNPLRYGAGSGSTVTISEGNLKFNCSSNAGSIVATINIPSSGKWYWEAVVPTQTYNFMFAGVIKNQEALSNLNLSIGNLSTGYGVYAFNGQKYNNGSSSTYMAATAQNTVMTVAYDADTGSLYVGAGGSWANGSGSTNQTWANAVAAYTGLTGNISPAMSFDTGNAYINFGQRPFAYTAPSGFKALCTQNLPTPTIGATSTTQADNYFNVLLYTGTSATQNITGLDFQPDWVWIKIRNQAYSHNEYDAVRGANKRLRQNQTGAEATVTDQLMSFNSNGFTLGADSGAEVNSSGNTFVAWNWKANGAGSSNTAGTITSTVSANTTSGFSIVTYTGNGSAGSTVGHGLGASPSWIITKSRSNATNWMVWTDKLTTNYALEGLNTTGAEVSGGSPSKYIRAVSSTTFTIGDDISVNQSASYTYVAYCFAPVAGYSAFGSYTGNGSADGPFVYTGFRPRYVMIKRTDSTSDWTIYDTSRSTYNQMNLALYANLSNAEGTTIIVIDTVSNGIKIRNSNADTNASGGTYIYACFAESPFKYALAR